MYCFSCEFDFCFFLFVDLGILFVLIGINCLVIIAMHFFLFQIRFSVFSFSFFFHFVFHVMFFSSFELYTLKYGGPRNHYCLLLSIRFFTYIFCSLCQCQSYDKDFFFRYLNL